LIKIKKKKDFLFDKSDGMESIKRTETIPDRPAYLKYPPNKKERIIKKTIYLDKENPLVFIFTKFFNDTKEPKFTRKVWLKLLVDSLKLPPKVKERFIELVGNRYDPERDILTLGCSKKPTKIENKNKILTTLKSLLNEAWRADLNFVSSEKVEAHVEIEDQIINERNTEINDFNKLDLSHWTTFRIFNTVEKKRRGWKRNQKSLKTN